MNDILNVGEVGSSAVTPITGFQLNRLLAKADAVDNFVTVDPSSTITINGKTFDGSSIEGINDGGSSATDATSENTAVRYGHFDTFTSRAAARSEVIQGFQGVTIDFWVHHSFIICLVNFDIF